MHRSASHQTLHQSRLGRVSERDVIPICPHSIHGILRGHSVGEILLESQSFSLDQFPNAFGGERGLPEDNPVDVL